MAENILNKITNRILSDNFERFRSFKPEEEVLKIRHFRSLEKNLEKEFTLIAELKKASPSKGVITNNFNPGERASLYEKGGAGCISVITEKNFFLGSPDYISLISDTTSLPILRKDFIIDISQIYDSVNFGADVILLIAACLTEEQLILFQKTANELGLETIIEVHNRYELDMALKASPGIVGINNRNLKDFSVSLERSLDLISHIPNDIYVISESGIKSAEDTEILMEEGFSGVLVGEILMRAETPDLKIRELKHEN